MGVLQAKHAGLKNLLDFTGQAGGRSVTMGATVFVFICGLGGAWYKGAPAWALILAATILAGIHTIFTGMLEAGREADRQIANLKTELRLLRDPPKTVLDYYED